MRRRNLTATDAEPASRGTSRNLVGTRPREIKQHALFDATRVGPTVCSVCGATRNPDQTRAQACTVDRDRQAGTAAHRRRPVGCLNTYDPTTTDIPY